MVRLMVIAAALLLLAGCKEVSLYSSLTEQEANEMVALMQRSSLPATKAPGKEGTFSVSTSQESFSNAVQLLKANGLPRPSFDSLGNVFKEQNFVSSSTSQRARYIHALSQEISNTISSIDGVLLARVHLAVPEQNPLADVQVESSASVFVKHRPEIDLSPYVSQIKALVVNGLENVPYDNVTVALFESRPTESLPFEKPINIDERSNGPIVAGMHAITPMVALALGVALLLIVALLFFKNRPTTTAPTSNPLDTIKRSGA